MDNNLRVRGSVGPAAQFRIRRVSRGVNGKIARLRRKAWEHKARAIQDALAIDSHLWSPPASQHLEEDSELMELGFSIQQHYVLQVTKALRGQRQKAGTIAAFSLESAERDLAAHSRVATGPIFELICDFLQAGGSFADLVEAISEGAWSNQTVLNNRLCFAKGFQGEDLEVLISGVDEVTRVALSKKELDARARKERGNAMYASFCGIWSETSLSRLALLGSEGAADNAEQRKRLREIVALASVESAAMTQLVGLAPAALEVREGMHRIEESKELDQQAEQLFSEAKSARYKKVKQVLRRKAESRRARARVRRLQGLGQATRGAMYFYGRAMEAPNGLLRFTEFPAPQPGSVGPGGPTLLPVTSPKRTPAQLSAYEKLGLVIQARYNLLAEERAAGFKERPSRTDRQKIAQRALDEALQDFSSVAANPVVVQLLNFFERGGTLRDLVAQIADPNDLQVHDKPKSMHFVCPGFSGEILEFDVAKREKEPRGVSDRRIEREAREAQQKLLYRSLLKTLGASQSGAESWASDVGKAVGVTRRGTNRRLRNSPKRSLVAADRIVNGADSTAGGLSVGDIQFGTIPGGSLLDFAVVLSILPAALDIQSGTRALEKSQSMKSRAEQLERSGRKEDLVEAAKIRRLAAKKRRQAQGQVASGGMALLTSSATSAGGLAGLVGASAASAGLGVAGGGLGVIGGGIAGVLALRNLGKGINYRSKLKILKDSGKSQLETRTNHYELLCGQLCVDFAKTQSFYANTKIATSLIAAGAAGGTMVGSGCLVGLAVGSIPSGPTLGSSALIGLGVGAGVGLGGAVALGATSVGATVARKGYYNYKQARLADRNPLKTELGIQARTYMMLELELEAKAANRRAPSTISTQIADETVGIPAEVYLKFLEPSYQTFVENFPEAAAELEKEMALCTELIGN